MPTASPARGFRPGGRPRRPGRGGPAARWSPGRCRCARTPRTPRRGPRRCPAACRSGGWWGWPMMWTRRFSQARTTRRVIASRPRPQWECTESMPRWNPWRNASGQSTLPSGPMSTSMPCRSRSPRCSPSSGRTRSRWARIGVSPRGGPRHHLLQRGEAVGEVAVSVQVAPDAAVRDHGGRFAAQPTVGHRCVPHVRPCPVRARLAPATEATRFRACRDSRPWGSFDDGTLGRGTCLVRARGAVNHRLSVRQLLYQRPLLACRP